MMTAAEAEKRGVTPIARIVAHSAFAHEPAWFTTAPVYALKKLLDTQGWSVDDVDLFEINEAFAVVTMAALRDVGISHDKVNVNGGAVALGHPIGATGCRISVTLLHELAARGLNRGIATQCIGGGEATAVAYEIV
jgi:acetyl-CoA C-acetyltransferase